jgi:hypothetical protein
VPAFWLLPMRHSLLLAISLSGGVASVGIIVNYYVEPLIHFDITDFVIDGVQVILVDCGSLSPSAKSSSLNTLVASLAYPLFYTILYRFVGNWERFRHQGSALSR